MNIKTVTLKDLQEMYGEKYKSVNKIAEDFTLHIEYTLEEAIFELFDGMSLKEVLNIIASDEIYEYIENHIAMYRKKYLIVFNEYF